MEDVRDYFSKAEDAIGSTFLRWDKLTPKGREQAFYHIKKTSRFLENVHPELFKKMTQSLNSWIDSNSAKIDSYIDYIDGYKIEDSRIHVFSQKNSKNIPLLSAPDLYSLIVGEKEYEFGDFIRMSFLIRDENYLYCHFGLMEKIYEKF